MCLGQLTTPARGPELQVLSIITAKGALYGIEPSTRNGKMLSTREEAAPLVPKNILTFESNTDTRLSFPIYYRCFHNCTVQDHFKKP